MKYFSLFLLATLSAVHARRLGQSAAGCPDADYYVFGDGYAAAFKSAPSSDAPDQLVKVWQPNDHDSQLHFGVNVGTGEQPVFAVLSENSDKLYRFAPCEAEPFGEQPTPGGMNLKMKKPVWAHYDEANKLLYVAMFGRDSPTGLEVMNIASPAADDWSFQSSAICTDCAHVHSVWGFKAGEILIADVGEPWATTKGKGVFRFSNGAFQQVSDDMNARVLATDPDGSHLYVVTQEDMKKQSQTLVYQLQRDNNGKLNTVKYAELDPHNAWNEGGAVVESLGQPGKVLVTDRSGNGGSGYVVDFNEKGNIKPMRLGPALAANNPRYSVLRKGADGSVEIPYTVLTADDKNGTRPVWKTEFTTAGDAKSIPASVTSSLEPASHIVQVR